MSKIKLHTPAKDHDHEVLHAHVDFEKKTLVYQLGVGAPAHHAELPDVLAEELLALIGAHAQAAHDEAHKDHAE